MKVNIDQGTAALLSEALEGQRDPGLVRLKSYVDNQLEKAKPSEQLTADELQALIELLESAGRRHKTRLYMLPADVYVQAVVKAAPKLRAMLRRLTDPAPNARAQVAMTSNVSGRDA